MIDPDPIERWDGLYLVLPPWIFDDPSILGLVSSQYPNTKIRRCQETAPHRGQKP
jgi:hypothetical protein